MTFEWYENVMIFIFLFFVEPTVRKDTWMRMISVTVLVTFSKVLFSKILDHSHALSSVSTITRHIDKCILKGTLQLKILRTWLYILAYSFIKTSASIIKQKWTKVPGKLSVVLKSKPALQRTLCRNIWHFIYFYTPFFLSNKNSFWI